MNLGTVYPLALVGAIGISGVVWGAGSMLARRNAGAGVGAQIADGEMELENEVPALGWARAGREWFVVLLAVFLLRSFVFQPFMIPSGSMTPTLLKGDFIMVSKFSYGLRLPVLGTTMIPVGEPKRGDVVVFRYPVNPSEDYIKRVIGLPGDRIVYRDKTIYVNGVKQPVSDLGSYRGMGQPDAEELHETLGSHAHAVLNLPYHDGPEGVYIVPPEHYFVMGDNRDNSNDSRYWGYVPENDLIGKAEFIWFNWQGWHHAPLWNRIGESIN